MRFINVEALLAVTGIQVPSLLDVDGLSRHPALRLVIADDTVGAVSWKENS
jgi:hypothetical protein